jgi:hypothetical protein
MVKAVRLRRHALASELCLIPAKKTYRACKKIPVSLLFRVGLLNRIAYFLHADALAKGGAGGSFPKEEYEERRNALEPAVGMLASQPGTSDDSPDIDSPS